MKRFLVGMVLLTVLCGANAVGLPGANNWSIDRAFDEQLGRDSAVAWASSENGLLITLLCIKPGYAVAVMPFDMRLRPDFVSSEKKTRVRWSVDHAPFVSEAWTVVMAKQGFPFSVSSLDVIPFIQAVRQGKEVLVITVHGVTSVLSLEGAAEAIAIVESECDFGAVPQKVYK